MSSVHVVEQGESLASIAARYGLPDWKKIYFDPANAEFRKRRPNPHVIYPGDEVVVPEKETRDESRSTEQRHRFKTRAGKTVLRIVLRSHDDEPLGGYAYKLEVEDRCFEGKSDSDGLIEHPVSPRARNGELTVWLDGETGGACIRWPLKISHLDPVEYLTGVQARLNNLGFESGPVDGIFGPITKGAVKAFQDRYRLKVDGIPGPITQAKLREVYGC